MQPAAKKRVVIVGGGVAGALLVKILQNISDVTLIDPYIPSLSFSH
jgi:NADH dehydrogenase FAD-containing subunit